MRRSRLRAPAGPEECAASAPTSTETSTPPTTISSSAEDPAGLLNGGGSNPKQFSITKDTFQIKVNGTALEYNTITFNNIKTTNKFMDYTIGTHVALKEGTNIIVLETTNSDSLGGTTLATAPIIDCIKLTTSAVLTWTPLTSNLPE